MIKLIYARFAVASIKPYIEVKSGTSGTLKSLHLFLQLHQASPYGIRFSTQNYSIHEKIHSYPLYAIAAVIAQRDTLDALHAL